MFSAFFRDLRTEFAGYNADKLLKDVMAGLTVCAVALPLALAFGVSSGASAAAGLVTAILAGIVIAILGGASYQVSGPTGAMSAVLIGIVAQYGLQGVFFACFAAGVLLLAAGLLKLGRLIGFIPMPVIMGFTSGIAIIIALGQVDNFFGTVSEGSSNLEKLASYARLGFHPNLQAVLIGVLVAYAVALVTGAVDYQAIGAAAWFGIPIHKDSMGLFAMDGSETFISAVFTIVPIALATMMEHIGDIAAISATTGKNYIRDPGLNKTLLGDGLRDALDPKLKR